MNIGINLLYLITGVAGGTETYARNLISKLFHIDKNNKYFLFVSKEAKISFSGFEENVQVIEAGEFLNNKFKRIIWEQLYLPVLIKRYEIAVLFSPGYIVPILSTCKHVLTVPDLLYRRFPDTLPKIKLMYWKLFIPLSIRRSIFVMAISEFTKNELVRYFPSKKNNIVVTQLAVDQKRFYVDKKSTQNIQKKYSLPDKFIVCVATISPHKNLEILLKAVSILSKKNIKVNVVLAGNKERSSRAIEETIFQYNIDDSVHMIGYVPEDELRQIYSTATIFILPSIYEGFGLPVLEAMSCGCPVLCSNAGSLPEVGGEAAEYFLPNDEIDLSQKIHTLYFNDIMQDELRQKGFSNIQRFSWEKTAQQTLKTIKSANEKNNE